MTDLSGKRVAVIATDYFEEQELTEPVGALKAAGVAVDIIAPHGSEIKGLNHTEPGASVPVDKTLDEADPSQYDALVIPGGVVNADHLRMESKAREFAIAMMAEEKPTAAICHGPWLLISSGLVRGRRLSGYYTLQDDIRNAGGEWLDEVVVVDGCLITSRTPDDLMAFNETLLEALAKEQESPLNAAM